MNYINWKKQITKFLLAQTISLFGTSLVQYAIVWYITLSTSSGSMMTISVLAGFLPQILISLYAGVWLDRFDRKKIAMISDAVIALSTFILFIAFMLGKENVWLMFIVMAVRSAGTGIQTPAVNSIVPQLVPKEHLMKVNGINTTISSIIMFLSPAASGAILSVIGTEATLAIDLLTAVIGIGITMTITIPKYNLDKAENNTENAENAENKEKAPIELKESFIYLKNNPVIKNLMIFQLVIYFLISPSAFLTPLLVSRTFGEEVWRLSMSEMSYSVGLVVGGALISIFGRAKKGLRTSMIASVVYGLLMIFLGLAPTFIIYLIFNAMIGLPGPWYGTPITVAIQERVPSDMHGRIFSIMQLATSCAMPFGMLIFGPLADIVPVQVVLIGAGILAALASIYTALSKKLEDKG